MSTHLTPDELHELWNELQLELRRLGGRLEYPAAPDAEGEIHSPTDSRPAQPPDSAGTRLARSAGAPARLLRILEALSRMRTGNYGICAACREPIPFPRLLAIPETPTCVQCSWSRSLAGR